MFYPEKETDMIMPNVPDAELDIEVVAEDDADYAVFADRADEPITPLEDCGELFERLDMIQDT